MLISLHACNLAFEDGLIKQCFTFDFVWNILKCSYIIVTCEMSKSNSNENLHEVNTFYE